MMTDRELLEKAAKAAGLNVLYCPAGIPRDCTGQHPSMNIAACPPWRPLTDDGDALGLAVKLRLDVHFEMNGESGNTPIVEVMDYAAFIEGGTFCAMEDCTTDAGAATRRAIVRAAATLAE